MGNSLGNRKRRGVAVCGGMWRGVAGLFLHSCATLYILTHNALRIIACYARRKMVYNSKEDLLYETKAAGLLPTLLNLGM